VQVYDAIAPHWNPERAFVDRDRSVQVRFEVDLHGNVGAIAIARSSGSDALDTLAVNAVRETRSMPETPEDLLDTTTGTASVLISLGVEIAPKSSGPACRS
jgi:TonB family protein